MTRNTSKSLNSKSVVGSGALETLLDVSQSIHQILDLDTLMEYVIRRLCNLCDAEAVSVILHDEKRRDLVLTWAENRDEQCGEILKAARIPIGESIAGDVFATAKSRIVQSVANDSRHYQKLDQLTGFETRSVVAVPLPAKHRVIGVLEVINKRTGTFNQEDLDFIEGFANIVGLALDNARIVTELKKAYEKLQKIDEMRSRLFHKTRRENLLLRREIESRHRFDQIKGCSDSMLQVFELCEKAIDSDITVLIEGETGTGKELVARCIHYNSDRKAKPFVVQNCGAIPEPLLAGELFGHAKGAFTGAHSSRRGLFEVADGGTVFLDEVAEMSVEMQKSLLRVLEEGEIKPLGTDHTRKVDVRIISATNKSLEDQVAKGMFREDLYYRLNVFTIRLPALRERNGDIPLLADHFLHEFNKEMRKDIKGISEAAMERLCLYSFPGNIRELRNEIQRAYALAEPHNKIDVPHLSEKIRCQVPGRVIRTTEGRGLKELLEELERSVIAETLEKHRGNKTRTAQELGISRYGLIKKVKRYNL